MLNFITTIRGQVIVTKDLPIGGCTFLGIFEDEKAARAFAVDQHIQKKEPLTYKKQTAIDGWLG